MAKNKIEKGTIILTGRSLAGIEWKIAKAENKFVLKTPHFSMDISVWQAKDILKNEDFYRRILNLLIEKKKPAFAINELYSLKRDASTEMCEHFLSGEDKVEGLYNISAHSLYPGESDEFYSKLVRFSRVVYEVIPRNSNISVIGVPRHRGITNSQALDVMLFFAQAGKKTYLEYMGGRKTISKKAISSFIRAEGHPDNLSNRIVGLATVVPRFQQVTNRSQKIKKVLETTPADELYRALSFHISGTLLVPDWLELFNFLRTQDRAPKDLGSSLGVLTKEAKAKGAAHEEELKEFLNWATTALDDHSCGDYYIILSYAIVKLGAKETVRILKEIRYYVKKIQRRSFIALIRQGGFQGHLPIPWQLELLPK